MSSGRTGRVEQADFDDTKFAGQVAGGSMATPTELGADAPRRRCRTPDVRGRRRQTWMVPEAESTDGRRSRASPRLQSVAGLRRACREGRDDARRRISRPWKLKDPKDFTIIGGLAARMRRARHRDREGRPTGSTSSCPACSSPYSNKCPVFNGKGAQRQPRRDQEASRGCCHAFVVEGRSRNRRPRLRGDLEPGVAIVADSWWQAQSARRQLNVTWDEGRGAQQSSVEFAARAAKLSTEATSRSLRQDGDAEAALEKRGQDGGRRLPRIRLSRTRRSNRRTASPTSETAKPRSGRTPRILPAAATGRQDARYP